MEIYAKQLLENGVVVVPIFSEEETIQYHRDYIQTMRTNTPELLNPIFNEDIPSLSKPSRKRKTANADAAAAATEEKEKPNSIFVAGGFGAFATASSFHNQVVRRFRLEMEKRTRDFFKHLSQGSTDLNIEQLIDRFCIRRKGTSTTAESWHRDQSPRWSGETLDNVDSILGGWVNLDLPGGMQRFSCNPGTHTLPQGSTGFSPLTDAEKLEAKKDKKIIDIPPGHWVVFYQNLVHEVFPTKSKYDSMRQFIGFRLTKSTHSLFEDVGNDPNVRKEFKGTQFTSSPSSWRKWVFENQSVPPIPSGQHSPMYAKMTLCFRKPELIRWAKEELHPKLVTENGLPKRFCPSLRDAGFPLFPAYSQNEIDLHTPRKIE